MKKFLLPLVAVAVILSWAPVISLGAGLFYVDDGGNVGIGNTTPQHKLDVSGAMYSRLVNATSSSINWNAGNVQQMTLTSSPTLTFSNGQAGGEYKLILTQDATGGRTVTWPASVRWSEGVTPTLSTIASSTDAFSFVFDGTNYLGSIYYYSAPGSIAFDSATQGSVGSSPTVQSYSHTTSGSNRILYVHVFTAGTCGTVTGATYDGTPMTLVDSQQNTPAVGPACAVLYRLLNPTSGSHTVAVSYAGSGYGASVATSYTGARQSGGTFVSSKNVGNPSCATTLTPNSPNNWIVMATEADSAAPTATGAGYLRQVGSNVAITAFDTDGGVSGATTIGASSDNILACVAESFEPAR